MGSADILEIVITSVFPVFTTLQSAVLLLYMFQLKYACAKANCTMTLFTHCLFATSLLLTGNLFSLISLINRNKTFSVVSIHNYVNGHLCLLPVYDCVLL